MTQLDYISLALVAWKECRSGGISGMTAVINVVLNRAAKSKDTVYAEIYRPLQFSSMSYQHDPQLLRQPDPDDPQWIEAQILAASASRPGFEDITGGATSYFANSIASDPPSWAAKMTYTCTVGGQRFYK
jgi:N-acetylmuramoyl-L-alanine amidase